LKYFFVALGLLILDQWTKWLVITRMVQGESVPLIDSVLYLTYVKNPGAAFGMLPYKTGFLIVFTIAVVLGILIFIWRLPQEKVLLKTGLVFQMGGAVGNLIDRIRFGSIIDFFDFRVWPVFNFADIAICIGVGILFYELIWNNRKQGEADSG
jgi:signal peptidase II